MPQLWAIFTEVQRYYDAVTVPDDVTLLLATTIGGISAESAVTSSKSGKADSDFTTIST